jgi:hypothetical protein
VHLGRVTTADQSDGNVFTRDFALPHHAKVVARAWSRTKGAFAQWRSSIRVAPSFVASDAFVFEIIDEALVERRQSSLSGT